MNDSNSTESSPKVETFTPVFDYLTSNLGLVTAAVYGVVWRHCQMERGACDCSLATMAELLGLDVSTVFRQLGTLQEKRLIVDTTPGLKRKPHTYVLASSSIAENNTTIAENNSLYAENNTTIALNLQSIGLKPIKDTDTKELFIKNKWIQVLEVLETRIPKPQYQHLFQNTNATLDGDCLTVHTARPIQTQRYDRELTPIISEIYGPTVNHTLHPVA